MQSLTYKFNTSTTQLNPAWLSIFSLWIILDVEHEAKEDKRIAQRTILQPRHI